MSDKAIYPRASDPRATASAGDLSEPIARAVRDELNVIRDEMRAELREEVREHTHSRTVKMNAGAASASLYGGGALALTVGLLLALVMPSWAAFLIVTAGLFGLALALRSAAHSRRHPESTPVPPAPTVAPMAGAVPPTPPTGPAGVGTGPQAGTAPGPAATPGTVEPSVPPTGPTSPPLATPDPHAPQHRA